MNYICQATNDIGSEFVIFSLEPGEKPPPVENVKVISISSEYVELELHLPNQTNVTAQESMKPNGFYVEYRQNNVSQEWNRTEFSLEDSKGGCSHLGDVLCKGFVIYLWL